MGTLPESDDCFSGFFARTAYPAALVLVFYFLLFFYFHFKFSYTLEIIFSGYKELFYYLICKF